MSSIVTGRPRRPRGTPCRRSTTVSGSSHIRSSPLSIQIALVGRAPGSCRARGRRARPCGPPRTARASCANDLRRKRRVADRQRLVDQEDVRLHHHGDREREPPVHAGRVGPHRHVHEVLELGEVDDLVVLLRQLRALEPRGEAAEHDVLAPGQLLLKPTPSASSVLTRPCDLDAPRGRRQDAGDRAHERRLAGAVGADDAEHLAVRDVEARRCGRPRSRARSCSRRPSRSTVRRSVGAFSRRVR